MNTTFSPARQPQARPTAAVVELTPGRRRPASVPAGAVDGTRHFERMSVAIGHLADRRACQPDLAELARAVHLSPAHFQREFAAWTGLSPKQMLRHLTLETAKQALADRANLADAAEQAGLAESRRLHELFVQIEAMAPAQYRSGGAGLQIGYREVPTPLGPALVAATQRGVCYVAFIDEPVQALAEMRAEFPQAQWRHQPEHPQLQGVAQALSQLGASRLAEPVRLHLRGTPFQLKVWQALLRIAPGACSSYGDVATQIGQPGASRAVGSAIGANPVAWLIPCHRVIRANGLMGQYRWQRARKAALLWQERLQAA